MDKLNITEINNALKDVRSAYRLLALYQKRLLDIIKYITNAYAFNFHSGWSKFSKSATHGNRVSLDKWSWDWLTMYLYEFNLGFKEIGGSKYYMKIVHQADTGYFDVNKEKKVSKINTDQFSDVNTSNTRLFFVLSKDSNGCPIKHILKNNLTKDSDFKIIEENWIAMPFDLNRFANQESTDLVLSEFNNFCKEVFKADLIK